MKLETMIGDVFAKHEGYRDDEILIDGIAHCQKCKTPRQKRMQLANFGTLVVRIMCKCEEEEQAEHEQWLNDMQFKTYVENNRISGMTDTAFQNCTFANAEHNPMIDICKRYVKHWEHYRAQAKGMMIQGGVGVGKTYAAACVANALLENGVRVKMVNIASFVSELENKRITVADALANYELLILDDIGTERKTEYMSEKVFLVVDEWYRKQLPLIVTTNLTADDIGKMHELTSRRIYDRIGERCVPIEHNGKSRRKAFDYNDYPQRDYSGGLVIRDANGGEE